RVHRVEPGGRPVGSGGAEDDLGGGQIPAACDQLRAETELGAGPLGLGSEPVDALLPEPAMRQSRQQGQVAAESLAALEERWPLRAAAIAACSPAGPPPATTISRAREADGTTLVPHFPSRPVTGFIRQTIGLPVCAWWRQSLCFKQGRISAARPDCALATSSG